MHNQRTYATNLDYETITDSDHWSSLHFGEKGHATGYLRTHPKTKIQLTRNGFIQIHSGSREDDDSILPELRTLVLTRDGQPLNWKLTSRVLGDQELQEMYDMVLLLHDMLHQILIRLTDHNLPPLSPEPIAFEMNRIGETLEKLGPRSPDEWVWPKNHRSSTNS